MANKEYLEIIKNQSENRIELWNSWRKENPDIMLDFVEENLNELDMGSAYLCKELSEAKFVRYADLLRADLSESDITGVKYTAQAEKSGLLTGLNVIMCSGMNLEKNAIPKKENCFASLCFRTRLSDNIIFIFGSSGTLKCLFL